MHSQQLVLRLMIRKMLRCKSSFLLWADYFLNLHLDHLSLQGVCEDIVLMMVSGVPDTLPFFHHSQATSALIPLFIIPLFRPVVTSIYTLLYCSSALQALVTTGSVPFYHSGIGHMEWRCWGVSLGGCSMLLRT
jgi:hypothetical protein